MLIFKKITAQIRGLFTPKKTCAQAIAEEFYTQGKRLYEQEDYSSAFRWFQLASQKGSSDAFVALGDLCMEGKGTPCNYIKAKEYYRIAADMGNVLGHYQLGCMAMNGRGGGVRNYSEAEWYLREAATAHHVPSMCSLGWIIITGKGMALYETEGSDMLHRAAEADYPPAQFILGMAYMNGGEFKQDDAEAERWLKKSFAQENYKAGYCLGLMYLQGRLGQSICIDEAIEYFDKAAAENYCSSRKIKKKLQELKAQGVTYVGAVERGSKIKIEELKAL